jgi:phosphonate transport system substrate-binding protein
MYLLNLATCMAESTESFCHGLAQYLEIRLGIPTQCVAGIPWQERERLFDQGAIQVLWLCGLPYVRKAQFKDFAIELLAVPIPLGSRYRAEPIYFSDILVKRESRFRAFHDLRGSSWAYNEPMSHSGFNVVRAYLAGIGYRQGFFREIVESGSHTASIKMILDDQVEASAIDTTVLDWLIDQRPEVGAQIRVIGTIGPSPIPPWVASTRLPMHIRSALRRTFLGMHEDSEGRAVLAQGRIMRFVAAHDIDYDPIRRMADAAATVSLL